MADERWSDQDLMAWADGELPAERSLALEAELTRDAALARRATAMLDTRALSREAWDAELDAPVPAALSQAVQALVAQHRAQTNHETLVATAPTSAPSGPAGGSDTRPQAANGARQASASPASAAQSRPSPGPSPSALRPGWWTAWQALWRPWPMGLAASALCAGLGFVLGSAQQGGSASLAGLDASRPLPAAVAAALQGVLSGDTADVGGAAFAPVASYRTAAGALCREFIWGATPAEQLEGMACREGSQWRLQAVARVSATGFAPASGEGPLAALLAQIEVGEALTPEAERAALAQP